MNDRIIGRTKPGWRQLNPARAVQRQHQTAGNHVPQLPIGLDPMPRLAQLGREPAPTEPRMGGNQLLNKFNVRGAVIAPTITKDALHARQNIPSQSWNASLERNFF